MESRPDVIAHNVETVPRLQRKIRDPRCGYERSLEVLRQAKAHDPEVFTKRPMVGPARPGSSRRSAAARRGRRL